MLRRFQRIHLMPRRRPCVPVMPRFVFDVLSRGHGELRLWHVDVTTRYGYEALRRVHDILRCIPNALRAHEVLQKSLPRVAVCSCTCGSVLTHVSRRVHDVLRCIPYALRRVYNVLRCVHDVLRCVYDVLGRVVVCQ